MKRVIAFVILGLLIYAGGFVTVYGALDIAAGLGTPHALGSNIHSGLIINDKLGSVAGKLGVENFRSSFLGVEFGEPTARHYFVIPAGDTQNFMLIAVTDPDDVEAIENVNSGGDFSFTGRIVDMDPSIRNKMIEFIVNNPHLVNGENQVYTIEIIAANHTVPYIIEVRDFGNPDYLPLIVGAAMLVIGGGLAALLIVKIVRERSGY